MTWARVQCWAVPVLILAASLVLLALGLALAGYPADRALAAMVRGSVGGWYALTSATLVRAIPLILIGLGIAIAFRAGVFNIGGEGQFLAGAALATWVGLHAGSWPRVPAVIVLILAGALGGLAWAALPAWLRSRFGVLEVISTLMLNFVAEAMVSYLVLGPLQEARGVYPQSDPIDLSARIPFLPSTRLPWSFPVVLIAAAVLAVAFSRTLWGFRLKAVGTGPVAAHVAGRIPVGRVMANALLLSGLLAGVAGALEVGGVSFALFQNLSPGYGFTAIAVALLARLHPGGIVLTGILFAALETGAAAMQRDAAVPSVIVYLVEAVTILGMLLAEAVWRRRLGAVESALS